MFQLVVDNVPDNAGPEFIVGFMENMQNNTNNLEYDYDVELFITTIELATIHVNISAPRYTGSNIFRQITITNGVVEQLFLDKNIRITGSAKTSSALHIIADNNIVVYGVNKAKYSNDAFLGIPVNMLGQDYYAITYSPASRQTEILVVGVEDGTSVSITLPTSMGGSVSYSGHTYTQSNTITETLDRFDTWQIVNTGGDLTGAHITSNKPIGVFSGNKKTNIGSGKSSDHLVEMWYPVERWGKEFVTIPIPQRTVGDRFRFVASEGSTTIEITGGHTATITLANAGDMKEEHIGSGAYCRIVSNKAVQVAQLVLSQQSSSETSDPSMSIIPSIFQFSYIYTFTTPKYSLGSYTSFLMVIIKDADKNGLIYDGTSISPTFTAIPPTEFVGGYVDVAEGTHTIEHSSRIVFFGAYLYGKAAYETYSFPCGMRLGAINAVSSIGCVCLCMAIFVSQELHVMRGAAMV